MAPSAVIFGAVALASATAFAAQPAIHDWVDMTTDAGSQRIYVRTDSVVGTGTVRTAIAALINGRIVRTLKLEVDCAGGKYRFRTGTEVAGGAASQWAADDPQNVERVCSKNFRGLNGFSKGEMERRWRASLAATGGRETAVAAPAEEEAEVDVILTGDGGKTAEVIRVIRAITGLGLDEAKALVEGAPKPLRERVSKAEAEKIKKQIEDAGGTVELK